MLDPTQLRYIVEIIDRRTNTVVDLIGAEGLGLADAMRAKSLAELKLPSGYKVRTRLKT